MDLMLLAMVVAIHLRYLFAIMRLDLDGGLLLAAFLLAKHPQLLCCYTPRNFNAIMHTLPL